MSSFDITERRINTTAKKNSNYPVQSAILVQLVKHICDEIHDYANGALKEYNINNTDYSILMMLYGSESGIISPSQLSQATGEKGANITRICNELYDKQLVNRVQSDQDRRKVDLSLTKKGLALIEELMPKTEQLLLAVTENIEQKDLNALEKMLKKVLSNSRRIDI